MSAHSRVEALRQRSRELVRELGFTRETFGSSGLTHTRCHALLEIERQPDLTVMNLAAILRLDKSAASRLVKEMCEEGLVNVSRDPADARKRVLHLSARGKKKLARVHAEANAKVEQALALLREEDQKTVLDGIAIYASALDRVHRRALLTLRRVEKKDDPGIASVIRTVMTEYGATSEGFAIHDAEVDSISSAYPRPRADYWVLEQDGEIVGGGGYGPLWNGPRDTCELRKMYFLPSVRGLGMGREILARALQGATRDGYRVCYLETLGRMREARRLYESMGFTPIAKPLGDTGHFGCDAWYSRSLE